MNRLRIPDIAGGPQTGLVLALCVLVVCVAPVSVAAPPKDDPAILELKDFGFGRPLIAVEDEPLQSVFLDFGVYRRSVEPGLADLRVFDEDGQPLPYAIRRQLPEADPTPSPIAVPIFELDGKPGLSLSFEGRFEGSDYQLDAELSPDGAVLSIRRGEPVPSKPDEIVAWLLDTSELERDIVRIDLSLADGSEDFVSRLRLERSNDLAHWQAVGVDLAVARLEQAGHRIERTSFEIPRTKARYLRLTPIEAPAPFGLEAVHVVRAPEKPAPKRITERIEGRIDPDRPDTVLYDLVGAPPIETVQVLLDGMNTIVEGTLESASEPEGPWRVRQRGVFYRFDRGGEWRNPKAVWNASRDRYLRLVATNRGGGLRGQTPQLEVVWRPEQLLFLERESGGATLAVGRAGAEDRSFQSHDLLRMSGRSTRDFTRATARLGPEFALAGASALKPVIPIPWRTYGLWALLLGIVGCVLVLSFRLMRSVEDVSEA